MFRHQILIAIRSFRKHPTTFLINLLGLSFGIAAALAVFIWISDELSTDGFHPDSENLYQVLENRNQENDIVTAPSTPGLFADVLAKELAEVRYAVTVRPVWDVLISLDEKKVNASGRWAGSDYFKMFAYLTEGNPTTALSDERNIVITDHFAVLFFGSVANAIGKEIEYERENVYKISGVMKIPNNSSEKFDFVIPYSQIKDQPWLNDWRITATYTYLTLEENINPGEFNSKIRDYISKKTNNEITHRIPFIQRYQDRYLYNNFKNGIQAGGRIDIVKAFACIGAIIVFMACFNFINLSTAKVLPRIKEIGVKKALGVGRKTLLQQFLIESTSIAALATVLAFLLLLFILPQFNIYTEKSLQFSFDIPVLVAAATLIVFSGIFAGIFPALYLTRFQPSVALQGFSAFATFSKRNADRQAARGFLVILQFVVTTVLIVFIVIAYAQVDYIQSKNIGYNLHGVICFAGNGDLKKGSRLNTFLNEVRAIPGVANASSSSIRFVGHQRGSWDVIWPGKPEHDKTEFEFATVDYDLLETLDIKVVEGRGFSRSFSPDSGRVVFNETAIKFMGLEDPIGKKLRIEGKLFEVIGIARDFNFESIHHPIRPVMFVYEPEGNNLIMIKMEGNSTEAIKEIEQLYSEFAPGSMFTYQFLEDRYVEQYKGEKKILFLSNYFGLVAIFISCLGLFGLATFTSEHRYKEIAIRKIHGATTGSIMALLTTHFFKLIIVSVIVAVPIAYVLSSDWLSSFAYRARIEWWYFGTGGLAILLITILTVAYQAIKAARVPVTAMLKHA
jgi:putative ABC transport system permease protein